jgi:hypothetical protein
MGLMARSASTRPKPDSKMATQRPALLRDRRRKVAGRVTGHSPSLVNRKGVVRGSSRSLSGRCRRSTKPAGTGARPPEGERRRSASASRLLSRSSGHLQPDMASEMAILRSCVNRGSISGRQRVVNLGHGGFIHSGADRARPRARRWKPTMATKSLRHVKIDILAFPLPLGRTAIDPPSVYTGPLWSYLETPSQHQQPGSWT